MQHNLSKITDRIEQNLYEIRIKMEYIRKQFGTLKERVLEPRKFMQVVAGPRQVGKSNPPKGEREM